MVSGIGAYRFAPVDRIYPTRPVKTVGVERSENATIARLARRSVMPVSTYAPYRSMRNKKGRISAADVSVYQASKNPSVKHLDTYA